jgi:hypothetical protein
MDSDAVPEEDKAGVRRLEAHDSTTIGEPKEVMLYQVTVAAATDLYTRAGHDTSNIRDYVGKVSSPQTPITCIVLSKRTDSSQLVDTNLPYPKPYGNRSRSNCLLS